MSAHTDTALITYLAMAFYTYRWLHLSLLAIGLAIGSTPLILRDTLPTRRA